MTGRVPRQAPDRLLRWGLPRDPRAVEHVLGFVVTAVLTVVVTRAGLQLAGFPQVGGEGLHVAHVLWGGLALGLAVLVALSFAGPVVRPLVAFLGGVGMGLFIDEVGKFLTDDNDYFFSPAPMIMYVTLVVMVLLAEVLHGRRAPYPSEFVAAAADHAVAGLAGGLSLERRAVAEDLLDRGAGAPGAAETRALLAAVPDDDVEVFDPLDHATKRLRALARGVVTRRWATRATVLLLVVLHGGTLGLVVATWEPGERGGVLWAQVLAAGATGLALATAARGVTLLRTDRNRSFRWLRWSVLVNLLLAQVGLFRLLPWPAAAGLAVGLAALAVITAERFRLERLHQAPV